MSDPISMQKGTSRLLLVPVRDQNGVPLDLSGAQGAAFMVAVSVYGTDKVITKALGAGLILTNDGATPPLWSMNIPLEPTDTEAVTPFDFYYYEASVVDSGGNPYVVASGQFDLKPALTT